MKVFLPVEDRQSAAPKFIAPWQASNDSNSHTQQIEMLMYLQEIVWTENLFRKPYFPGYLQPNQYVKEYMLKQYLLADRIKHAPHSLSENLQQVQRADARS